MKYTYLILYFVILFLLTTIWVVAKEDDLVLRGKVIAIDPGHGGKDVGTSYQSNYEKDINLAISLQLKKELEKKGASVILTRDDDYDLSSPDVNRRKKSDFDNRIDYINNSVSDLYLSIHINYLTDTRYSGGQVFYLGENKELANAIQNRFNKGLDSEREVKKMQDSYYMYKRLTKPGVLIECGFLSNATERKKLVTEEYQNKIAKTIVDGLIDYYKQVN